MCHQPLSDTRPHFVKATPRTLLALHTALLLAARMLLGDAGRATAGVPTMMVRLVPPQLGGAGVICQCAKGSKMECQPTKCVYTCRLQCKPSILRNTPASVSLPSRPTANRRTVSDV